MYVPSTRWLAFPVACKAAARTMAGCFLSISVDSPRKKRNEDCCNYFACVFVYVCMSVCACVYMSVPFT